ncbi:MAG TPA: ribonuclease J [Spirochaetota bacterium]|nr:ribonuclease J [Spirochaetota bacterium]
MKKNKLKIIFLGGLKEIGKNLTILEYSNQIIIIDCGFKFPKQNNFGIDCVINDFSYLISNRNKIKAIVITHGHLDHIGALPYLLQQLGINIPVYAPSFAVLLIESLFREFPYLKIKTKTLRPERKINIGFCSFIPVSVSHSIIDAFSYIINTPAGNILYTGDFKISDSNFIKKITPYTASKIVAMFSDSTNAITPGYTKSEKDIVNNLKKTFLEINGRIIISTFSTHLERISNIISIARELKRKIIVVGRSMENSVNTGIEKKFLQAEDVIVSKKSINKVKPERCIVLITGTQGEPLSGLSLLSENKHRDIKLSSDDTIILSASSIPGNEYNITQMKNNFAQKEINVLTNDDIDIHASGHASENDIFFLLNIVKPKFYIPIHGEAQHMLANKKIALKSGIAPENIFLLDNGDILEIGKNSSKVLNKLKLKNIYIENKKSTTVTNEILNERKILSVNGCLFVNILLHHNTCRQVTVKSKGLVDRTAGNYTEQIITISREVVSDNLSKNSVGDIKKILKKKLRKYFSAEYNKNPILFIDITIT